MRRGSLFGLIVLLGQAVCHPPTAPESPGDGATEGGPTNEGPRDVDDDVAPSEACRSDDDCTVTDFTGCCACCGCSTPYAIRRDELARQQDLCAIVDCDFSGCDEECAACPIEPLGTAACEDGRCVRHGPGGG
jgi:hypothetical protein